MRRGQLAAEYYTATPMVMQPAQTEFGTRYLLPDHLGSTRATSDAAATSVKYFDYLRSAKTSRKATTVAK